MKDKLITFTAAQLKEHDNLIIISWELEMLKEQIQATLAITKELTK